MKLTITKYIHSCLLVEADNKVALFDPGTMSTGSIDISKINQLDYIFVTHVHGDHLDKDFILQLVNKFPEVQITTTTQVVKELADIGIKATTAPPQAAVLFEAPHESVEPLLPTPEEIGVNYMDVLSHPGDSHHFSQSKQILALPITAPWGSAIRALNLAIELKPKHVIPIHDWHWRDEAREGMYQGFESVLGKENITFHSIISGEPIEIETV